jgi:hypothetical protein
MGTKKGELAAEDAERLITFVRGSKGEKGDSVVGAVGPVGSQERGIQDR